MMDGINELQLKTLHTLLGVTNLKDEKEIIVQNASAEGYSSSKRLTRIEAMALIQHLRNVNKSMDKMRKKMLHYGYLMLFDRPINDQQIGIEPFKLNYQNVNAWCVSNKSKYKKKLNRLNPEELKDTLSQFERVYKSFNNSMKNYGNSKGQIASKI